MNKQMTVNAPINVVNHQATRVYEIYHRDTREVIGTVEVTERADIEFMHPWVRDYVKSATEATGSRTGVRYIGESITRKDYAGKPLSTQHISKGKKQ